jgi:hypothetical protein
MFLRYNLLDRKSNGAIIEDASSLVLQHNMNMMLSRGRKKKVRAQGIIRGFIIFNIHRINIKIHQTTNKYKKV